MVKAELYNMSASEKQVEELNSKFDDIANKLNENDVKIIFKTEVELNAKRLTDALNESIGMDENVDVFIVANLLDSQDNSSFKEYFAEFVAQQEQIIQKNDDESEEHPGKCKKVKIYSLGDLGNGYRGFCFSVNDKKIIALPSAELAGAPIDELIEKGVLKAFEVFKSKESDNDDGCVYADGEPRKKQSFWASVFPQKGDKPFAIVRKLIVIIAALAFLVTAGYLINDLVIQPLLNKQIQSEVQNIFYEEEKVDEQGNVVKEGKNWEKLAKINKEIVAWIQIDNTKIDYPVLDHNEDNSYSQYYLNRNYKKEYSDYGSIFLDYRSIQGVDSKNVIVHGHHMNDGSMFGDLMEYAPRYEGDLDFYKSAPTISFDTPEGDREYKIISVFKTNTLYAHGKFFNYMQGTFESDAEFMNFVYNVRERSLFDIPVTINENDQILTLSTCSYEYTSFRTVVVARLVREGESASVDTSLATINKDALWPDVYYSSRGGTKPKVTTFQTAYKAGEIDWYDGDGVTGKETLTLTEATNPTEPPTNADGSVDDKYLPKYTIKFINYDGSEISTQQVIEGHDAVVPPDPVKPEDADAYYVFKGWGLDTTNVFCDMIVAPIFEEVKKTQ